jgi:hypothetical protein
MLSLHLPAGKWPTASCEAGQPSRNFASIALCAGQYQRLKREAVRVGRALVGIHGIFWNQQFNLLQYRSVIPSTYFFVTNHKQKPRRWKIKTQRSHRPQAFKM